MKAVAYIYLFDKGVNKEKKGKDSNNVLVLDKNETNPASDFNYFVQ